MQRFLAAPIIVKRPAGLVAEPDDSHLSTRARCNRGRPSQVRLGVLRRGLPMTESLRVR